MDEPRDCLDPINTNNLNDTPLTLSFKNITSKVTSNKNKDKVILNDVSGTFHPGRLTAILGPSGAGKTTLINILAGYKTKGVTGSVLVNDQPRVAQDFQWQFCCIGQDSALLPMLTTQETLLIAADLKIPSKISTNQKHKIVSDIADILGLRKAMKTRVSNLSGGEVKRLSIGVELVTNPPIMFFDEPTSGLDSISSGQVVSHLRTLAQGGRTVVCVIHQPSSRIFDMFDDLYVVANGRIIYGGPVSDMVAVFQSAGFKCPQYYNRADFALEVASCEVVGDIDSLMEKAINRTQISILNNNTNTMEENSTERDLAVHEGNSRSSTDSQKIIANDDNISVILSIGQVSEDYQIPVHKRQTYAISHWRQFIILLKRSSKCTIRDTLLSTLRLILHGLVGVILGLVFYNIGDEASKIISNTAFLFFILLFIFFANSMPTVVTFPQEAAVFQKESLNNWYSLPAYYFSKIIADLPLQLLCPTLFMLVSYVMTDQPADFFRVAMLLALCILFTIISQGMGLLAGVAFNPHMALFVLPAATIPMLMFSGFFIRFDELPAYMHPLSYTSYFGYGFEAIIQTVYGYDRPRLKCSEPFCLFTQPSRYLKEFGIRYTYKEDMMFLFVFIVFIYILLYAVLKFRLWKSRW